MGERKKTDFSISSYDPPVHLNSDLRKHRRVRAPLLLVVPLGEGFFGGIKKNLNTECEPQHHAGDSMAQQQSSSAGGSSSGAGYGYESTVCL